MAKGLKENRGREGDEKKSGKIANKVGAVT